MNSNNLQQISSLLKIAKGYSDETIEATIIEYVSKETQKVFTYEGDLANLEGKEDYKLLEAFHKCSMPITVEFIVEFFEALLDKENIVENGIVFTPKYIADYIYDSAIKETELSLMPKIIDPGCGCGIFLASSAVKIHEHFGCEFKKVLNESIFGIELDKDNARRCEIVLNLLPIMYGESNEGVCTNIKCQDSLKCDWNAEFGVDGFDFIFGNPPYVNTHDMSKETSKFLKETFMTTQTGVYNIFYAFIEHAYNFIKDAGIISYIIPNNFLTIKSAMTLRKFILERKSIRLILDFSNNMVFKPVRTYNCIIQLTKSQNDTFHYCVMDDFKDIEEGLKKLQFESMPVEKLDLNGWKLVDRKTMNNIHRIEGQFRGIKDFIRTGIATLRDDVYIVKKDSEGYYKIVEGKRYNFEDEIIKRLYKIPELKADGELKNMCRYIIFPYKKGDGKFEIITEKSMRENYPKIYAYLNARRDELDSRDKGKANQVAWYAYGRTQGLNKYGIKLLFPTFSNQPRFKLVDDEYALFCNGYAIFQNDYIELDLLQRILNSYIMQYYVSNTSYAIEGGYYCYQKKYIEKFSIPLFTDAEREQLRNLNDEELDKFLIEKYGLEI